MTHRLLNPAPGLILRLLRSFILLNPVRKYEEGSLYVVVHRGETNVRGCDSLVPYWDLAPFVDGERVSGAKTFSILRDNLVEYEAHSRATKPSVVSIALWGAPGSRIPKFTEGLASHLRSIGCNPLVVPSALHVLSQRDMGIYGGRDLWDQDTILEDDQIRAVHTWKLQAMLDRIARETADLRVGPSVLLYPSPLPLLLSVASDDMHASMTRYDNGVPPSYDLVLGLRADYERVTVATGEAESEARWWESGRAAVAAASERWSGMPKIEELSSDVSVQELHSLGVNRVVSFVKESLES